MLACLHARWHFIYIVFHMRQCFFTLRFKNSPTASCFRQMSQGKKTLSFLFSLLCLSSICLSITALCLHTSLALFSSTPPPLPHFFLFFSLRPSLCLSSSVPPSYAFMWPCVSNSLLSPGMLRCLPAHKPLITLPIAQSMQSAAYIFVMEVWDWAASKLWRHNAVFGVAQKEQIPVTSKQSLLSCWLFPLHIITA